MRHHQSTGLLAVDLSVTTNCLVRAVVYWIESAANEWPPKVAYEPKCVPSYGNPIADFAAIHPVCPVR